MYNKKGGIGQEWVFALATLFGLTVLVLTMNMVFHEHLAPSLIDAMPDTDAGESGENGISFFLTIWDLLPYIVGFMVVVFLLVVSVKKEPVEGQY